LFALRKNCRKISCFKFLKRLKYIYILMKRYISISLSLLMVSLLNVLTWLCLSFSLRKPDIANVFSLTYPIWFVVCILVSVFGTGANIRKYKKNDNSNNSVFSGMIWGIVIGGLLFGLLAVFSDKYVQFMNLDVETFESFARFTMLQAFAWLVFQLVLEKFYFEDKDLQANIHGVCFYALSFAGLIVSSLFTKNENLITYITLGLIFLYTFILFTSQIRKFKFEWNFLPNIKYESVSIFSNIFFFVTYFVGYSNAFAAGEKYIVALNLVNLITDPQWDALGAVGKIAKIDLARDDFNFKSAVKKSAALTCIYILSSCVLFFALFKVYKVSLSIGLIFLMIQFADMLVDVFSPNIKAFLELEYSPMVTSAINLVIKALRTVMSVFLLTPFNTNIAQIVFDVLGLIIFSSITLRFFKLGKNGQFYAKKKKLKVDNIVLYVDRKFKV